MNQRLIDSPEQPKTRAVWFLALMGIAFSYLYFIPYFEKLNNPNENSRVYQIRAFVETGKLSVNDQIERYGWVNDLAKRGDKLYAGKAPATTFIGVPIYAALRASDAARGLPPPSRFRTLYTLRLFGVLLPCLLFIHLFRGFIRQIVHDGHTATALTVILALGTMMLPYGLLFVNHSLSAAASFGCVMAVLAAVRLQHTPSAWASAKAWTMFGLAGFLLASSTALDYALFPISVFLLGFVFWRAGFSRASVVGTCVGTAAPTLLTAAYHQACWGSPFSVSMSFLANSRFAAEAEQGMFGIVGPTSKTVWGVLGSAPKGLVYFSPVLGFGLVCVVVAALTSRLRKEAILTFALVLWMMLYNVSLINWDGGWTVGPRYVSVTVPFLVFAIALIFRQLSEGRWGLVLAGVVGLGIASVVATASASVKFPHLQPDYDNPLFECIWPLWRDGITPYSLGRLLGLSGHADQSPYLVVVGVILVGLLAIVAAANYRGRLPWARSLGGVMIACCLALFTIWLQSLPSSEERSRVERGTRWLRTTVWEPPLSGVRPAQRLPAGSPRRPRR